MTPTEVASSSPQPERLTRRIPPKSPTVDSHSDNGSSSRSSGSSSNGPSSRGSSASQASGPNLRKRSADNRQAKLATLQQRRTELQKEFEEAKRGYLDVQSPWFKDLYKGKMEDLTRQLKVLDKQLNEPSKAYKEFMAK